MEFRFGKKRDVREYKKRPSRSSPRSMSERLGRSQSAYLQHKKDKNITLPEAPWDDAETETPEDLE